MTDSDDVFPCPACRARCRVIDTDDDIGFVKIEHAGGACAWAAKNLETWINLALRDQLRADAGAVPAYN